LGRRGEGGGCLGPPPLGYIKKLGLDPAGVAGTVAASVSFNLPAKKDLKVEQVKIAASADIADAAIKGAVLGQDLTNGDANLKLDRSGMTMTGSGKFAGAPLGFTWEENFGKGDFARRISASGPIDSAQRAALGHDLSTYVDGPIDTAVVFTQLANKRATVDLKLGLAPAT